MSLTYFLRTSFLKLEQNDLTVRARLYARAGIVEYWVLDLNAWRLIVHREPDGEAYRSVVAYSDAEKVAPLGAPQSEVLVGEMLSAEPGAGGRGPR